MLLPPRQPSPQPSPKTGQLQALLGVGLLAVAFGLYFVDRDGWEGDNEVLKFSIQHFDIVGQKASYRYAWQPLAYESLIWLHHWAAGSWLSFETINAVAGMLGVSMLIALVARRIGPALRAVSVAAVLVLSLPELWVTALYFNATALALPFFVAALWAAWPAERPTNLVRGMGAGLLFGVACALRLDYLLALPFVLLLCLGAGPAQRENWWGVLGAMGILGLMALWLLLATSLFDSIRAIAVRYSDGEYVWSLGGSLRVLAASIAPAVVTWPLLLWGRLPKRLPRALWWLVAASLPMALPIRHLYSGKYVVPLLACLPVILALALRNAAPPATLRPRRLHAAWAALLASWLLILPRPGKLLTDPVEAFPIILLN